MSTNSDVTKTDVRKMIMNKSKTKKFSEKIEKLIPILLFLIAYISVLITIGIIDTLLLERIEFFKRVPIWDFFTGTLLNPLSQNAKFGILPLLVGTIASSVIAMAIATPIGLMSAIYLSEYASDRVKKIFKPLLEFLAGIQTIVYGFFAFPFVTPLLREFIPGLEPANILSPGIVMGVMIIPMIASMSEDAMNAVPNTMREGALALGATKLETTFRVVIPAALSGIIVSIVLAVSRAIGETMIVTIAS